MKDIEKNQVKKARTFDDGKQIRLFLNFKRGCYNDDDGATAPQIRRLHVFTFK